MFKAILSLSVLFMSVSCSNVQQVNRETSQVAAEMSMIENSAYTIERAIATEERVRGRFDHPKK